MRTSPIIASLALLGVGVARAEDGATAGAGASDPQEYAAFRDTLERYSDRMREFQGDVRHILDVQESEERQKLATGYGVAMRRLEESESALRRVAIQRLEGFLQKYPTTKHSPDMTFRLADLYFEESEVDFATRMEEYGALEAQLEQNPSMLLPEPPKKDYGRSIALYRQIVDRHPEYEFLADTYYMLGYCLSRQNAEQYDADAARDVNLVIVSRFPGTPFANDANMQLGEYYFDLPGTREAPTQHVHTAIKYYEAVLTDGPEGKYYDEAIYKLGWSHYKLNDYDRSLGYLVQLLDYSEEQFLKTGKVSNMRPEAVEYLAITYADIAEREGRKPYEIAQAHLNKVGDRKWQHDVVERLADILWAQAKWEASVDAYAFLQTRWPEHPTNPIYQQNVALLWAGASQNAFNPPQTHQPMPFPDPQKAAQAFALLAERYTDGTPWYIANRGNPDAIAVARGFIETSLASVATEHLLQAQKTGNLEEYRLAASQYREFLDKFPFADNYEEYEWYLAYALFSSNQFAEAEKVYQQILKNERSSYRDGARLQLLETRKQLVLAKFGKLEDVPTDAVVEQTVTTPHGKQITRYMVSDEHKAFVAACDDLLDREFTDPEQAPKLEEIRAAVAYIPAQILFNHGDYEGARLRFEKVMARFPKTQEALFASRLYVQTYNNEGDLANVAKYAGEFKIRRYGPAGEDVKLAAADFTDAEEAAKFMLAYQKIEKGDRAGAAEAYMAFMAEYPASKFFKDALFNAANNFEAVGKATDANRLFEQYIAKYPTDERSKVLYFRIASNYSSTLDLQKATNYYESLVKLFPDYVDSPAALFNAAFLRVGMGDHAGAARAFERYATQFDEQPDAELAFWRAGEQWEQVGSDSALDFYQRYLKRYPTQDANHQIEAWYKIAKHHEKKGDARRAGQAWTMLQSAFMSNSGNAAMTSRIRSMAAEGALNDLLRRFDGFKQVKWSGNEAKNVEILTKTKPEELKALTDQAVQLIQVYQDYDTAAASLYLQGMAYFAYADMAYEIPPPKGLTDEEIDIYRSTVDEQFRIPAEDRGKARLVAALEKAKAEKRWSEWNSKTMAALNERYPAEYPSERQESRGRIRPADLPLAGAESISDPGKKETP